MGTRHHVPSDLEAIPPGPFLGAILSAVDRSLLNGHDAVRVMQADARMEAYFASLKLESAAEVSTAVTGGPDGDVRRDPEQAEFADTEIAAALRLTRRAADNLVTLAWQLRQRLPEVWELLHAGAVDIPRAKVVVDATAHLPADEARSIAKRASQRAPQLTTGELRALLARLCIETDPEDAKVRYEEAWADRRVETSRNPDGTANVFAYNLEPHTVSNIVARLHRSARRRRSKGEPRTMDQLRADSFAEVLLGDNAHEPGSGGVLEMTIDLETLAGLADRAGEIPGFGPVIADVARRVFQERPQSEWRYAVTNSRGHLLVSGVTQRRPDAAMRRRVTSRDSRCVFPGCRMPSTGCDIDHTVAYSEGGITDDCNLAPLCRYHHRAKHEAPWNRVRQTDGDHRWTSSHGHTYITTGRSP